MGQEALEEPGLDATVILVGITDGPGREQRVQGAERSPVFILLRFIVLILVGFCLFVCFLAKKKENALVTQIGCICQPRYWEYQVPSMCCLVGCVGESEVLRSCRSKAGKSVVGFHAPVYLFSLCCKFILCCSTL